MFMQTSEALILIALGIGYIVIYLAKREEKQMQFLGYTIGAVIIVLAIVYLAVSVWFQGRMYCFSGRRYDYRGKMHQRAQQLIPPAPQVSGQKP